MAQALASACRKELRLSQRCIQIVNSIAVDFYQGKNTRQLDEWRKQAGMTGKSG
jgi:hypothetical protein